MSQLDSEHITDTESLNCLKLDLEKISLISSSKKTLLQYLQDIISQPQENIGAIYIELYIFRDSFPANIFVDMIEEYHFLPKVERLSKNKDAIIKRIIDKYELDAEAKLSINDIYESFLEAKQDVLVQFPKPQVKAVESNEPSQLVSTMPNDTDIINTIEDLSNNRQYNELVNFVAPLAEQCCSTM